METVGLADFERAIGRLSIRWAIAEHGLDRSISVLHHVYGGDESTTQLPMNARAKIKYFRKASLAHFAEAQPFIEEIANEAFRLLDERNWCIHGTALQYERNSVAYPVELRRLARPDLITEETKDVTVEHINKVADDCAMLAVLLCLYQCKPLGLIRSDHVEDVFRRFGVKPPF